MKVRVPRQLEMRLDRSLAWRKRELTSHKLIVDGAPSGPASTLRRAGIVLLYAHWEGFIKEASKAYLELASSTPEVYGQLRPLYQAMAIRSEILSLVGSKKVKAHSDLLSLIDAHRSDAKASVRIRPSGIVTSRGNVNAAVLRELMENLGLDFQPFALKEKPVIDRLVKLRHSIAHGNGSPVDEADYELLHVESIALLDVYKEQILAAGSSSYWRL